MRRPADLSSNKSASSFARRLLEIATGKSWPSSLAAAPRRAHGRGGTRHAAAGGAAAEGRAHRRADARVAAILATAPGRAGGRQPQLPLALGAPRLPHPAHVVPAGAGDRRLRPIFNATFNLFRGIAAPAASTSGRSPPSSCSTCSRRARVARRADGGGGAAGERDAAAAPRARAPRRVRPRAARGPPRRAPRRAPQPGGDVSAWQHVVGRGGALRVILNFHHAIQSQKFTRAEATGSCPIELDCSSTRETVAACAQCQTSAPRDAGRPAVSRSSQGGSSVGSPPPSELTPSEFSVVVVAPPTSAPTLRQRMDAAGEERVPQPAAHPPQDRAAHAGRARRRSRPREARGARAPRAAALQRR